MDKKVWLPYPVDLEYRKTYRPFYDVRRDYNTNAPSYYDYLARHIHLLSKELIDMINRSMNRDISVTDTNSIDFTKTGDWISEDDCDNYSDVIDLKADVIISNDVEQKSTDLQSGNVSVPNGTQVKSDGVWSPDYGNYIKLLEDKIEELQNYNTNLEQGLQKIVDNLFNSGAITSNDIATFNFKNNRDIATGNINFFGAVPDGSSFIRTNDGTTQNDVTAGY